MKNFIDANAVANTVRMMRTQFKGTVLIVEGDSDALVYKRFTARGTCEVLPSLGKANATGALAILERGGVSGVLAVVDCDFWRLEGRLPGSDNLFTTDTHDIETMIISSRAFDKVTDEFAAQKRLERTGKSIRGLLLEIGRPIGFFRWIASSEHENLSLSFKNLSLGMFVTIEAESFNVDIRRLIREVRHKSPSFTVDEQDLVFRIKKLMRSTSYDPWHVCRGHDLVHILLFLFKSGFGNRRARNLSLDILDSMLRIAYDFTDFSRTELFKSLKRWEHEHPEYTVLVEHQSEPVVV